MLIPFPQLVTVAGFACHYCLMLRCSQVNGLARRYQSRMALRVTTGDENVSLRLPHPCALVAARPSAQHYVESEDHYPRLHGTYRDEKYGALVGCDWPGSRIIVCRFRGITVLPRWPETRRPKPKVLMPLPTNSR